LFYMKLKTEDTIEMPSPGSRKSPSPKKSSQTRSAKRRDALDKKMHAMVDAVIAYFMKDNKEITVSFAKWNAYRFVDEALYPQRNRELKATGKLRDLLLKVRETYQKAKRAGVDVGWVTVYGGKAY